MIADLEAEIRQRRERLDAAAWQKTAMAASAQDSLSLKFAKRCALLRTGSIAL
jgi:hypothetical protein